jgi:hypothetical protein
MPKGQQQYPPEYRRKIVELANAGRPLRDLLPQVNSSICAGLFRGYARSAKRRTRNFIASPRFHHFV